MHAVMDRRVAQLLAFVALVDGALAGCGGTTRKPKSTTPPAVTQRAVKDHEELFAFVQRRIAEARERHRSISPEQIVREWAAKKHRRVSRINVGNAAVR
jgi:hypothetical protein